MAYVWFKISDLITPIRVSTETEIEGLDGPEMGVLGLSGLPASSGIQDCGIATRRAAFPTNAALTNCARWNFWIEFTRSQFDLID